MNREEELLYKILDYPIVQYITIKPRNMFRLVNWQDPFPTGEPRIYVFKDWEEAKEKIKSYKLDPNQVKTGDLKDSLMVITHNIEILDIKYRTYSVVLVGNRVPRSLNVYSITTRDFYRQSLNFMLYNEKGNLIQSKVVRLD